MDRPHIVIKGHTRPHKATHDNLIRLVPITVCKIRTAWMMNQSNIEVYCIDFAETSNTKSALFFCWMGRWKALFDFFALFLEDFALLKFNTSMGFQ